VAELLAREEPGLVVARQARAARAGRVLIDWYQNDRAKTTIAVYSLRAGAQPSVSTPLTWAEVEACASGDDPAALGFTAAQVLARVDEHGDLFADVLSRSQLLPGA
jgi:bifunctional non-homologous end joining protein LigD